MPEAEFFTPQLTTVRQDFTAVGRASIGLLLGLIDRGPDASDLTTRQVVTPNLIVRHSAARPT